MGGDILDITKEEYAKLGKSQSKGLVHITSLGGSINISSVAYILPDELSNELEFRNAKEMKLHDGSIAVRKFGQWVDKFSNARLDQNYYPEIAKDISKPIKQLEEPKEVERRAGINDGGGFVPLADSFKK